MYGILLEFPWLPARCLGVAGEPEFQFLISARYGSQVLRDGSTSGADRILQEKPVVISIAGFIVLSLTHWVIARNASQAKKITRRTPLFVPYLIAQSIAHANRSCLHSWR